jgi:UDP-N-acetylmuramate dehydrogenase
VTPYIQAFSHLHDMTLSQDSPRMATSTVVATAFNSTQVPAFAPIGLARPPIRLPETDCVIKPQVSLSTHTSFRVGGPAEFYVAPRTTDELVESLAWARSEGLPITMLGAGSNLLVSDRGLPGLVVSTRFMRHIEFDLETAQVTVGAGEMIPRLAGQIAERGWSGFEWAVGIPGTIGGAVVMNAGAHTGCMADVLVNAHVLTVSGEVKILTPAEIGYAYRTSKLQGDTSLTLPERIQMVTQATLQLQPGANPESVRAATRQHLTQRHSTQPYDMPSCGSVFRNPTPHKAGWLIEQSGLKGYQIGGAQVANRHANFILNCGGATATDIFRLIHHVQEKVDTQWSLKLEPEVKIIGDFKAA